MPTIVGKALGQKKPLFADFSIPLPPDIREGEGGLTLGKLIERIVRQQVAGFRQRQESRKLLRVFTARQIAEGVERGKIESGGSEVEPQQVDEEEAVATALQAYEDGLYLVVIDGQQPRSLEQEVFVSSESKITFVRLTLLAGG